MPLVVAEGALLDHILDNTCPIWSEGLTRTAYGQWNNAQLKTKWGRDHLQRFALLDDNGDLLASAKRYRIDVRLDGRDGWMAGIGAVFTPPPRRGEGHATRIIELLIERERAAGALMAALFSEIGAAFYERIGFRTVRFDEATVTVRRKDGSPAMLVRAGEERDLPTVAAMHAPRIDGVRFAVRRDPALIGYALSKKRLLAGLGPPGLRQVEFFVADSHLNAFVRLKLALTEDQPTISAYDEKKFATLADMTLPVAVSIELVRSLHARWMAVYGSMKEDDWRRTFRHPEYAEPLTLDWQVQMYGWHSRHHVAHITALRQRDGW